MHLFFQYAQEQEYKNIYVINKNKVGMAVYFKLVLEEIRVETFADKYSYFTSEINLLQLIPTSLVFAFKVAAWIEAK